MAERQQATGTLAHYALMGGSARALIAHTTGIAQEARTTHGLSATATAALGRALTGTAMLAAGLKDEDDSLSLSLRGGGPLGAVVCVGKANGSVKGYVDHPLADPPRPRSGKLDVGGAIGTDGFLTVVRDLGYGEPYVGRTPLVSGEVAEDIAYYLLHSEQMPSLLALGVLVHSERVLGSGGALLQPLPGCPDGDIARMEGLSGNLSSISHLAGGAQDVFALADACLGDIPRELLETTPIAYRCDCGRTRMESVLISLGEEELLGMMREQHGAEITCHFCASQYRFTEDELRDLLAFAKTE